MIPRFVKNRNSERERERHREMVNRGSNTSRFRGKKFPPSTITFYTLFIFAFSIFLFFFYVRNIILDQDPQTHLSLSLRSRSHQVLYYPFMCVFLHRFTDPNPMSFCVIGFQFIAVTVLQSYLISAFHNLGKMTKNLYIENYNATMHDRILAAVAFNLLIIFSYTSLSIMQNFMASYFVGSGFQ